MRNKNSFYPRLRRDFKNCQEIADVINRNVSYVWVRMSGKEDFTYKEKKMICAHLDENVEAIPEIFAKGA